MDKGVKGADTPITLISVQNGTTGLEGLRERAAHYRKHAKGDRTDQTYRSQWRLFVAWCEVHGLAVSPGSPEVVCLYLTGLADAGKAAATVRQALSSIRDHYKRSGDGAAVLASVAVRETLEGILRLLPKEQKQTRALTADLIKRVVDAARADGDSTLVVRDVALFLVWFAAGLRREELAFLGRADVVLGQDTASLKIVRSKGSQKKPVTVWVGAGQDALYCPLAALRVWLDRAPDSVYLFCGSAKWVKPKRLSYQSLNRILEWRLMAADIDPDGFSLHAFRAGLVTSLNQAGLPPMVVQHQTRHASADMLGRYHRPGDVLQVNYTQEAGL